MQKKNTNTMFCNASSYLLYHEINFDFAQEFICIVEKYWLNVYWLLVLEPSLAFIKNEGKYVRTYYLS